MSDYICKKPLSIEKVDDNGFFLENEYLDIEEGDRFQSSDATIRIVGDSNTIRLCAANGTWLEILPETLSEYFEEAAQAGKGGQ